MSDRPKRRKIEESSPPPAAAAASDTAAEDAAPPADTAAAAAAGDTAAEDAAPPADTAAATATDQPTTTTATTEAPAAAAEAKNEGSMTYLLTASLPSDDPEVVIDALKKLERLWYDNKKICKEASDLGAPLSIVSTMRKWQDNEEVMQRACLCVLHLTYHLAAARSFFLDLGALEVTTAAMNKFPESAQLHEYGCNLLHNLFLGAKGAQKKTKEGATAFVKEHHGIELIVNTTLKQFTEKQHFQVQMNACAVLEKLAVNGFRQQVIHSGAVRAIAPIFDAKPKNKELEGVAKDLMKTLFGK